MRRRGAARGLVVVTAIPLAAGLFAGQPARADSVPPEWPLIGAIGTGSASNDTVGTGSAAPDFRNDGIGSGSAGGALDLEPRSGAPLATGSAIPGGATSRGAMPGSAAAGVGATDSDGRADGADDTFGHPVPRADSAAGTGEALGLAPGSVQSACTGSAVIGSTTILLGLATGSGGSGGSGVVGPALVGTGSVGSSGSALGSVVVGSAVTGSALLSCLLQLPAPVPPEPGIPLQLGPPAPGPQPPPISAAPVVPSEFPAAAPAPVKAPETPSIAAPHRAPDTVVESTPDRIAWNLLELVTVMVVTVLTVVRRISVGRHAKRAE
ncbi:hypothetical protein [Nocardia sp. CA-119907]|uniref:hypothetical protein n=1 Tax=Nocardia sp. CA-119907 TaxID=3239973 RepID=UPI003D98F22A